MTLADLVNEARAKGIKLAEAQLYSPEGNPITTARFFEAEGRAASNPVRYIASLSDNPADAQGSLLGDMEGAV